MYFCSFVFFFDLGPGGVRSAKERALLWVGGISLALGLCLAVFWTQLLTLVVHSVSRKEARF